MQKTHMFSSKNETAQAFEQLFPSNMHKIKNKNAQAHRSTREEPTAIYEQEKCTQYLGNVICWSVAYVYEGGVRPQGQQSQDGVVIALNH